MSLPTCNLPDPAKPVNGALPPDASCWWPRPQEEQWAAKNLFINRLTAWAILGLQGLIILSAFFTSGLHLDILAILAGFGVLRGSQAWLRFITFTSCFTAASLWIVLFPGFLGKPVEIGLSGNGEWGSVTDSVFWSEGVSISGVYTMQAALCILCLRIRRLNFWTKQARFWGGIAILLATAVLILGLVETVTESQKLRALEAHYETELTAIRSSLTHRVPRGISSSNPDNKVLRANPRITIVTWEPLKGTGSGTVYTRDRLWSYDSRDPSIRFPHRLPSGEHGHIVIYLDEEETHDE
ncbi:MAG: hypothetical protein AAGI48_00225 [Verrucomicrobiota bacterium]